MEPEVHDGQCPKCGGEAEFMVGAKLVEVICGECGNFTIAHSEFDTLQAERLDQDAGAER